MFSRADFFACHRFTGVLASPLALLALAAALAGCASFHAPQTTEAAVQPVIVQPEAPVSEENNDASAGSAAPEPVASTPAIQPASPGDVVLRLLAYADRLRTMPGAELAQEISRLGSMSAPADQVQLALVLSQQRQTPELIRAQDLLTRVINNPDAQARELHALARLLATRFGEQRRIEDLLDKQSQQTRELQRRLDQSNERLEALKAIERSLTSRSQAPAPSPPATVAPLAPASAASAPASRSRGKGVAP